MSIDALSNYTLSDWQGVAAPLEWESEMKLTRSVSERFDGPPLVLGNVDADFPRVTADPLDEVGLAATRGPHHDPTPELHLGGIWNAFAVFEFHGRSPLEASP